MTGYTRQSITEIAADQEVKAEPLNAEFNALATAFNSTTGHAHDGTSGSGPKISLTSSVTGNLPVTNIADNSITHIKLSNIANNKVLGNVSGSTGSVSPVDILDEDNMISNRSNAIPTQQSVKAYVDTLDEAVVDALETLTVNIENSIDALEATISTIRSAPIETFVTASGTHTFNAATKYFQVTVVGAGGAGGAVSAVAGTVNYAAPGGHSGWFGTSNILAKGVITSATITIGAGGTSPAGGTGIDGGTSTYTDGVNTFTAGGGDSLSSLSNSGGAFRVVRAPQTSTLGAGLRGSYNRGGEGYFDATIAGDSYSGSGGPTPYGAGGEGAIAQGAGSAGRGYGSGGSGSYKNSGSSGYSGGAGAPGVVIIREWV